MSEQELEALRRLIYSLPRSNDRHRADALLDALQDEQTQLAWENTHMRARCKSLQDSLADRKRNYLSETRMLSNRLRYWRSHFKAARRQLALTAAPTPKETPDA